MNQSPPLPHINIQNYYFRVRKSCATRNKRAQFEFIFRSRLYRFRDSWYSSLVRVTQSNYYFRSSGYRLRVQFTFQFILG